MNIKVSKVFAKFANDAAASAGVKFFAQVVSMPASSYRYTVGDVWNAIDYGDYKSNDDIKALLITYPASYYACPRYVSTRELVQEFKRRQVRDAAGLSCMLVDMFAI